MKEKDTLMPIVLGVLVGLVVCVISFPGLLFLFGCASTNSCAGAPPVATMTSIPTLPAATMPAPKVGAEAIISAPKCHIEAVKLIGAWVTAGYDETKPFIFTDLKGLTCSATFTDDVQPLFNTPNLWFNGSPACTTCHFADVKKATKNMDLSSYAGILAGSGRANAEPKGKDILGGGNWDQALLYQMLYAPSGQTLINRPAMPFGRSAISPAPPANGPVVAAGSPGGSSEAAATPASAATVEVARPSNPGDAGPAAKLTGDATKGAAIFTANCAVCHGAQGQGGVANPGSDDGTVPALNPIDDTLVSADSTVFIYNLDLFLEHGSTPAGSNPTLKMPAWGDDKKLQPQQIADAIAYVMSLNTAPAAGSATETPAATVAAATTAEVNADVARPSNAGGAGLAVTLTGNADSGKQLFAANCAVCHNAEGKGGLPNAGSDDGTVPTLNPIDATLVSADTRVFTYNLDLFLEHGSTPEGDNPTLKMPAWGDDKKLMPQQIADLIAYLMSLNSSQVPAATATP